MRLVVQLSANGICVLLIEYNALNNAYAAMYSSTGGRRPMRGCQIEKCINLCESKSSSGEYGKFIFERRIVDHQSPIP